MNYIYPFYKVQEIQLCVYNDTVKRIEDPEKLNRATCTLAVKVIIDFPGGLTR